MSLTEEKGIEVEKKSGKTLVLGPVEIRHSHIKNQHSVRVCTCVN